MDQMDKRNLTPEEMTAYMKTLEKRLAFEGREYEEFIDKVWKLVHPRGHLGDWEYPAQVTRHLEEVLTDLRNAVRELQGEEPRKPGQIEVKQFGGVLPKRSESAGGG
jgi:hypothetical protein